MPQQLTSIEVSRAVTLLEEGYSQRYVAQQLGVVQGTVWKLWKRYRETGTITRRAGTGRQRKTTAGDERFLRLQALRNRTHTARDLQEDLLRARGTRISDQTVRNRLREVELRPRRPAKVPKLTRVHRQSRLEFGREHLNWQLRHWTPVMFSDESKFVLTGNDGHVRVWRRPGERFMPNTVHETVPFGGGSIMVWGGITVNTRTDLVVIRNGGLTARRYIDEILKPQVIPRANVIGQNFIFMQDNARPHIAHIVTDYLDDQNIRKMYWPACSPDMNPIEHVWDQLGKRVRRRPNPPITTEQLAQALVEEWDNFPQDALRRLIRSMPRRCTALVQARGGHTKY
jgi:transposase